MRERERKRKVDLVQPEARCVEERLNRWRRGKETKGKRRKRRKRRRKQRRWRKERRRSRYRSRSCMKAVVGGG